MNDGVKKMPVMELGRCVVKSQGREAGRKAVIVDILDRNFVLITGPQTISGIKRKRANIKHLEPLEQKVTIPRGAGDEEVETALEQEGLIEDFKTPVKI